MLYQAEDGEIYLTTTDAAREFGVAHNTVSGWRSRGLLIPIPQSPPHKPIYRFIDVAMAEKKARDNAIRTSGTDKRVRRQCHISAV